MSIPETRLRIEEEWRRWCAEQHLALQPQSLLAFLQYRRWLDLHAIEIELKNRQNSPP